MNGTAELEKSIMLGQRIAICMFLIWARSLRLRFAGVVEVVAKVREWQTHLTAKDIGVWGIAM